MGAVACYKVKREVDPDLGEQENWTFTKMWVKGYPVQTGCLYWDEQRSMLLVGFDDGSIKKLQIEGLQFSEVADLKIHGDRVTGIAMQGDNMLSVSDFGTMAVTQSSNTSGEGSKIWFPTDPNTYALKHIL